jgi:glycosyltransferase involved in cell wall biosynthesis
MLRRAVDSVLSQAGVNVELIVVLNGDCYAPDVITWLRDEPRITCALLPGPDKPSATALGRSLVTGDFFSYLDDDDEYLPGGLARRAAFLVENPQLDCVATNGEYVVRGTTRPMLHKTETFARDYIDSLLDGRNWMASCGATFRTRSVLQKYFDDTTRHYEWTLIAFRVASYLNVAFVDEPTYRVHDTAVSLSKTATYMECRTDILEDMKRWNTRPGLGWKILRNRAEAYHSACSYHRLNGNFRRAWFFHLKSLTSIYGMKYVPYTLLLLARNRTRVPDILRTFGIGVPASPERS